MWRFFMGVRKLIFRGKSVSTGEWLYGYLGEVNIKVLQSICKEKVIFENLAWFNTDNFGYVVNDCSVDESTIGQFTGLQDKNGTDIYEGDILRSLQSSKLMVVVYDEIGASFVVAVINKNSARKLGVQFHISKSWLKKYPKEVIGNIHDNPNLMED